MNQYIKTSFLITSLLLTYVSQTNAVAPVTAPRYNIAEGFADMVTPLIPAVVNISTVQKSKKSPGEQFGQFFENFMGPNFGFNLEDEIQPEEQKLSSLGSGFIIDPTGFIVTNYHVIAEADKIAVKLNGGGRELIAKVVGVDKRTDLALLKVSYKKPLPYVKFGDSEKQKVGNWVITIGNPFGLGSTVTSGIVSATGREVASEGIIDNFIQTDSALNVGNSGGPMFNIHGEVIGITNMILSSNGGNIGIGFATPSSIALPVIEQLRISGKIRRGVLGIRMQPITEEAAESLGLDSVEGVLIVGLVKKSAAVKAGVKVGDVLIEFNGSQIKTGKQLFKHVSSAPIGKELSMTVLRQNKKHYLKVVLPEDKENSLDNTDTDNGYDMGQDKNQPPAKELNGALIAKLDSNLRDKYNIDNFTEGLVILGCKRKSVWFKKGFRPGDVLISANQLELGSFEVLESVIKAAKSAKRKSILLLVNRGGVQMFTSLPTE
jgi:serine protease Do